MGSLYHDIFSTNTNGDVNSNDINKPDNETNKIPNVLFQQKKQQNDQTEAGNNIAADTGMQVWPSSSSQAFFDHERNVEFIDTHVRK